MFDSYYNKPVESSTTLVNIKEQKAPTDESIKLYKELEEKALNSILSARSFPNNLIKFNTTIVRDIISDRNILFIHLSINGEEFLLKNYTDLIESIYDTSMNEILKKLSQIILENLVKQVLPKSLNRLG